jgi:hypothetical protein
MGAGGFEPPQGEPPGEKRDAALLSDDLRKQILKQREGRPETNGT